MNRIGLKERIAISSAFTIEERDFLLDAINAMPDPTGAVMENPGNYMGRIEHLWAYLSVDSGGEGVCAAPLDGRNTVPLIAADNRRLMQIKPWASTIARALKMPVRLAKFSNRVDVEIFRP